MTMSKRGTSLVPEVVLSDNPEEDFSFYFRLISPLVLKMRRPDEMRLATDWLLKLANDKRNPKLRTEYLLLLLFSMQRRELCWPFSTPPPRGNEPLPEFEGHSDMLQMMQRMATQRAMAAEIQPDYLELGGDYREYPIEEEIPNLGMHCHMATPDEFLQEWRKAHLPKALENIVMESEVKLRDISTVINLQGLLMPLLKSIKCCMAVSPALTCLEMETLPFGHEILTQILEGVLNCKSLQMMKFYRHFSDDQGHYGASRDARSQINIYELYYSYCNTKNRGVAAIEDLLKRIPKDKVLMTLTLFRSTVNYEEFKALCNAMRSLINVFICDIPDEEIVKHGGKVMRELIKFPFEDTSNLGYSIQKLMEQQKTSRTDPQKNSEVVSAKNCGNQCASGFKEAVSESTADLSTTAYPTSPRSFNPKSSSESYLETTEMLNMSLP